MKIIKEELQFEENLKQRLEFICEFAKVTPTFINGSIRKLDRITRSVYDWEDLITFLEENDAYIDCVNDEVNTTNALRKVKPKEEIAEKEQKKEKSDKWTIKK